MGVRHNNVSEMLAACEDESLQRDVEKRISSRQIIKQLLTMRASRDMSQKDIAEKLGCTQSRVSKLENGTDDELRLGDLTGYLKALDYDLHLQLAERGRSNAV